MRAIKKERKVITFEKSLLEEIEDLLIVTDHSSVIDYIRSAVYEKLWRDKK